MPVQAASVADPATAVEPGSHHLDEHHGETTVSSAFSETGPRADFKALRARLDSTRRLAPADLGVLFEFLLIIAWALFVGRAYLDFDVQYIPDGSEFGSQIQGNHLWTRLRECGWCSMWNGSEAGGLPAFVDVHGSMLHPAVALPTLAFGVITGVKLTLLISLILAGVGQWWIARELRVSIIPRLWTAGIAVAGGHLASRMQTGNYHLILSAAAASLVFAAILHLGQAGGWRAAVLLGIALSSFALSGQGYLQIGMLGVLPAALFVFYGTRDSLQTRSRQIGASILVGLLLAAPLLVPVLHFSPYLAKETDTTFRSVQPLAYLPLNLVIDDYDYYISDALGKLPYPQLYALYIGWIPVLLAVLGLFTLRREERRAGWFLATGSFLGLVASSAMVPKALAGFWPSLANLPFVGGLRFPTVIAALCVPLILGLAAPGLQHTLELAGHWPSLSLIDSTDQGRGKVRLPLGWILAIPLVLSLVATRNFTQRWYRLVPESDLANRLASALRTDSLQWVGTPFGAHFFIEPAIARGLKVSPGIANVIWRGREWPMPALYASFEGAPPGTSTQVGAVDSVEIYSSGETYAYVSSDSGNEACLARGTGGNLVVSCDVGAQGVLIVEENTWTGWHAWMDGKRTQLLGDKWLEVAAPAGKHTFEFRYLPWDVPVGLVLFVAGVAVSVWLWRLPAPADVKKFRRRGRE